MRFLTHKHAQPPTIIIVSLIDILIVLLIFLMVTTTFKQQPALKLALPESKQAKPGSTENSLLITIAPKPPYFYLGAQSVTFERLQAELQMRSAKTTNLQISIRADTDAPVGQVVKVMDLAKSANIGTANIWIKPVTAYKP